MAEDAKPRIKAPSSAKKGEVDRDQDADVASMETGLRKDAAGNVIPRKIINKFTCRI